MASDPSDPILAFLLGRTIAEQLGLGAAQANQWGGLQVAFGLSPPGILVVHELARRDAQAQAEQFAALRLEVQALQASVERLEVAGTRIDQSAERAEQAVLQAARTAEAAEQAAGEAASTAARIADVAAGAAQQAEEIARRLEEMKRFRPQRRTRPKADPHEN